MSKEKKIIADVGHGGRPGFIKHGHLASDEVGVGVELRPNTQGNVDTSSGSHHALVNKLERRIDKESLGNAYSIEIDDAGKLPFVDESVHTLVYTNVLSRIAIMKDLYDRAHHDIGAYKFVENDFQNGMQPLSLIEILREVTRVLQPGGTMVINETNTPDKILLFFRDGHSTSVEDNFKIFLQGEKSELELVTYSENMDKIREYYEPLKHSHEQSFHVVLKKRMIQSDS